MVFLVTQTYRIRSQFRDEYLAVVPQLEKGGMDLGCAWLEVYESDDEPNRFTEMQAFDSWTHWQRIRDIPPTREMEAVFRNLDQWIEGGLDGIQTDCLKSLTR